VITVGVDLAAEAAGTAVARLRWTGTGAVAVTDLVVGADDAAVLTALQEADRAGLDCPFGWPEPFVEMLLAHRDGRLRGPDGISGLAWRRTLSRRATDLACEQVTGVRPLSVSADRIAAVAMRGAGLLGALAAKGRPVDRAGGGTVVECYPAAALRAWGLPHQSYKRASGTAGLNRLVNGLLAAVPSLDLGGLEKAVRSSDDAFDALVCALVARAASLRAVTTPPSGLQRVAEREGWIAVPCGCLRDLPGVAVPDRRPLGGGGSTADATARGRL